MDAELLQSLLFLLLLLEADFEVSQHVAVGYHKCCSWSCLTLDDCLANERMAVGWLKTTTKSRAEKLTTAQ